MPYNSEPDFPRINEEAKNPENWPPGDFPDPNPFFPPAPRAPTGARWSARLRWYVSILTMVVGVLGFLLCLEFVTAANNWPGIGVYALCVLVVLVGLGTLMEGFQSIRWRYGRFVPVQVTMRATALPDGQGVDFLLELMCHGLGFALRVVKYLTREGDAHPNTMVVQWLELGRKHTATVRTELFWDSWESGDICWLCICPPFRKSLVVLISPPDWDVPEVPDTVATHVQEQLKQYNAMSYKKQQAYHQHCLEERDRIREEEADLRTAAETATRKLKQTDIYNR